MLPWSRGSLRQIPCATGTELQGLEGIQVFWSPTDIRSSRWSSWHWDFVGLGEFLPCFDWIIPYPLEKLFCFVLFLLCNIICWKHGICFLVTQGLIVKRLPMNQKQLCTFELWGLLKLGMCFVLWSIYKPVDIRCGNLWFKRICVLSRQEVDLWWLKFAVILA